MPVSLRNYQGVLIKLLQDSKKLFVAGSKLYVEMRLEPGEIVGKFFVGGKGEELELKDGAKLRGWGAVMTDRGGITPINYFYEYESPHNKYYPSKRSKKPLNFKVRYERESNQKRKKRQKDQKVKDFDLDNIKEPQAHLHVILNEPRYSTHDVKFEEFFNTIKYFFYETPESHKLLWRRGSC